MVAGGQHHIVHAGLLRQLRPFPRHARLGVELARQLLVLRDGDVLQRHHPFVAAHQGIQPVVDEHPETGFAPPRHPFGSRSATHFSYSGLLSSLDIV